MTQPVDDRPATPERVENEIRRVARHIARGVPIVNERYVAFQTASRVYDVAYAKAYLDTTGSVDERKAKTVVATETARAERDVAEAAWRYARTQAEALRDELMAWQSVAKSVNQMFGAVGVSERD